MFGSCNRTAELVWATPKRTLDRSPKSALYYPLTLIYSGVSGVPRLFDCFYAGRSIHVNIDTRLFVLPVDGHVGHA